MLRAMARRVGNKFPLLADIYRSVQAGFFQYRGVYHSFREAEATARGKKLGFNHRDVVLAHKVDLGGRLDSSEYPVLFHLHQFLRTPGTILDLGGGVGRHYLRYRNQLTLSNVNWIVCDLPEMVKEGRELCAGDSNITFVSEIAEIKVNRIDVLLACSSLQYIDIASPDVLLRQLINQGNRPRHILIDQLPLYDGDQFVTLQHNGGVRYPQHVFNRSQFLESIVGLEYELIDCWDNRFDTCIIPFHPDKAVRACTGLCFLDKQI